MTVYKPNGTTVRCVAQAQSTVPPESSVYKELIPFYSGACPRGAQGAMPPQDNSNVQNLKHANFEI